MEDKKRAILNMVAEGRLSPREAAEMLENLGSDIASAPAEAGDEAGSTAVVPAPAMAVAAPSGRPARHEAAPPPRPEPGPTASRALRIRVNAHLGQATVVGDPDVHEVHVDGPHNVRREGDTLVVDAEPFNGRGFYFDGDNARTWGKWTNSLYVRVNPEIDLWVSAQAGSVQVRNINAAIHAEAQAGSVNIDGFNGPIELTTQAGSVRARGRLDRGASTIRCEAGSVRVQLLRGSSVQVSARSTMGQVRVNGARPEGGGSGRLDRLKIGNGDGTLDIETTIGSVKLEVES